MKTILKIAAFISIALCSSAIGQQISGGGGGATAPGGSTTQFQYNNSSAFAGSTNIVHITSDPVLSEEGLRAGTTSGSSVNITPSAMAVAFNNTDRLLLTASHVYIGSAADITFWNTDTPLASGAAGAGFFFVSDGVIELNNGTHGTLGALQLATLTATTLASDATHTDATVCVDTTTGLFLKGSGTVGICLGTSSARFKRDIFPLDRGMKLVSALKPKKFHYKNGYGDDGAKEQWGFIAEDVVQTDRNLVGLDKDGKPNSVDLVALIPVLTKAIQEQQVVIDCLRAKRASC